VVEVRDGQDDFDESHTWVFRSARHADELACGSFVDFASFEHVCV
jgi:hypothetical protein